MNNKIQKEQSFVHLISKIEQSFLETISIIKSMLTNYLKREELTILQDENIERKQDGETYGAP